MNGELTVKHFIVYELRKTIDPIRPFYKLESALPDTRYFDSHEQAAKWIQDEGKPKVHYTILEVYTK